MGTEEDALLVAATRPLTQWLDDLPHLLTGAYAGRLREPTAAELERLAGGPDGRGEPTSAYACDPEEEGAATILVARRTFAVPGAEGVTLASGHVARRELPCCVECALHPDDLEDPRGPHEPSDPDDSLEGQAREFVVLALGGYAEYRRPHRPRRGERPDRGPWLEQGWIGHGSAESTASARVGGECFERVWRPWRRRGR